MPYSGAAWKEARMSRAVLGMVIEKLLTDERLRIRFALDGMETIAETRVNAESSKGQES